MGYDGKVLRLAQQRLIRQRTQREQTQTQRRREVYERVPRLAALDRELSASIVEIIQAAVREGSDPVPAIRVLHDRNMEQQSQRTRLLVEHGYPKDYLDDGPACELCGDTGYNGTQMCGCLKALYQKEQIRELSSLLDLGDQSFDTFTLEYYSDVPWPGWELSPQENMEMVYEICLDYARKFGRYAVDNLFLSGAPGLGKTFLSACIAREVSERGFSVVYDTAPNILARFEAQKFSRDEEDTRRARDETRRYLHCDLLILDDLGTELTTPFTQSALYQLMNSRLVAARRTIISSNLSPDEISGRYSPQIASRLRGTYRYLPFFGEDIRLKRR